MHHRILAGFAPLAAVVVLAGCSSSPSTGPASPDSGRARNPVATSTQAGRSSGSPAAASAVATQSTATAASRVREIAVDPAGYHRARFAPNGPRQVIADAVSFRTPSHDIRCTAIGAAQLLCAIESVQFRPAPRPSSCHLEWLSQTVTLDASGVRLGQCAGDSEVTYSSRVLPYGRSLTTGRITCESAATGLTCRLAHTTHDFVLSRAALNIG